MELKLGKTAQCRFGENVRLSKGLIIHCGGELTIGDNTFLNPGTMILCSTHVAIGPNCAISWLVQITDSDIHGITGRPRSLPIKIGAHVWIGAHAKILKGVTIGDGAVIGAGAVVTKDVPARTVAAGNPARVVAEDISWEF
ncbi:MAG: acyltransferase [Planctomycetaceae bacterium]